MKRAAKSKNIMELASAAAKCGRLIYSNHANERMLGRDIIKPEVEYVLTQGHHEARKDAYNEEFKSWDYAIRGRTLDGRFLRIVIAVVAPNVLIVTAIGLSKEEKKI